MRVGLNGRALVLAGAAALVWGGCLEEAEPGPADTSLGAEDPSATAWTSTTAVPSVAEVSGELRTWHRVTLSFPGPESSESGEPNPFLDYRMEVTFRGPDGSRFVVPGFFAADGRAADTGADEGGVWRVHFAPDAPGDWTYEASFQEAPEIALDPGEEGRPTAFDGDRGGFRVAPTDKQGRDHRGKGLLAYVGERYLRFTGTGEPFLKGGANSPENFLAYEDFDGTRDLKGEEFLHAYRPHLQDWRDGDPTWGDGRGKGIIGALNYLAQVDANALYFITYTIDGGDGGDVWPWREPRGDRLRFDVSKLEQWEVVFSHMDARGIMLHLVLQEIENDQVLDGGELGPERRLYLRELAARFSHHPALVWNLGEENTNTDRQRRAFAAYIRELDPYDHPIAIHTLPRDRQEVYSSLVGFEHLEVASLQTNDAYDHTREWVERSAEAGRAWVVNADERGPAGVGAKPDADDPDRQELRAEHLWANLMAGGGGVEWFFGYDYAHSDIDLEDFRSRHLLWETTAVARSFFLDHVPLEELVPSEGLNMPEDGYGMRGGDDRLYALYFPRTGDTGIELGAGRFEVLWFDPREGGRLEVGSIRDVEGPGEVSLGRPPGDEELDWAAVVRRVGDS